jgi:hypothetical protein
MNRCAICGQPKIDGVCEECDSTRVMQSLSAREAKATPKRPTQSVRKATGSIPRPKPPPPVETDPGVDPEHEITAAPPYELPPRRASSGTREPARVAAQLLAAPTPVQAPPPAQRQRTLSRAELQVRDQERRDSWYEAAQVDPFSEQTGPGKVAVSERTMVGLEALQGASGVGETDILLFLVAAMALQVGVGFSLFHAQDADPTVLAGLGAALLGAVTQKVWSKPLAGLGLLYVTGHGLWAASLEGMSPAAAPGVLGALGGLCGLAMVALSDPSVRRILLVVGAGAVVGAGVSEYFFGHPPEAEPVAGGVWSDGTGLSLTAPEGLRIYDASTSMVGWDGPTAGLKAFLRSPDRRIEAGLVAVQMAPSAPLDRLLDQLLPPNTKPIREDKIVPDALHNASEVQGWRYPGGTRLIALARAGDGRSLALFFFGSTSDVSQETQLFNALAQGLRLPDLKRKSSPAAP